MRREWPPSDDRPEPVVGLLAKEAAAVSALSAGTNGVNERIGVAFRSDVVGEAVLIGACLVAVAGVGVSGLHHEHDERTCGGSSREYGAIKLRQFHKISLK